MTAVVVTAEVENGSEWEQKFRTHVDLFREYSISKPVQFAVDGNHVTICFEPDDLDKYMSLMDSEATVQAMTHDGVKRETVKIVPLDRTVDV